MTSNQLVQMALSAIIRCKEQVDLFELINILRGRLSKTVKQNGYNSIKTFGIGRLFSRHQWHYWIIQMIQQDIIFIDYDDNDYLKVLEKGHQVLKGEIEVTLKRMSDVNNIPTVSNDFYTITFNRVTYNIDLDIRDSINWRKYINDFNTIVYWNYLEERLVNVNDIIPQGIKERERVKVKFIELITKIYNLTNKGEVIIVPKKVDFDIYGNEVLPLSLSFDECLARLEQFIKTTGRYPQMKALADEVALRKWYREVGHGIISITSEQRETFNRFKSKYPNIKIKGASEI
jgi:hypothetical protein